MPGVQPVLRTRLTGVLLLLFGLAWTISVYLTIAPGDDPVGPRAFPFGLGILLTGLALVLIGQTFVSAREPDRGEPDGREREAQVPAAAEWWAIGATVGLLVLYGLLMNYFGFIIASALTVASALVFVLGRRGWRLVLGMSAGLSLGTYLLFGKLLGIYLPIGQWADLSF